MHFLPSLRGKARFMLPELRRRLAAPPAASKFVADKVSRVDTTGSS
jgi:hypothetical protein